MNVVEIDKVGHRGKVAHIEDKHREDHLSYFCHVLRRHRGVLPV